jgi:hypothetical protein
MVEVTEADKQMVADYLAAISINMPNLAALILANESALARCFAAHREAAAKAERDRLRDLPDDVVAKAAKIGYVDEYSVKMIATALADALESQHD